MADIDFSVFYFYNKSKHLIKHPIQISTQPKPFAFKDAPRTINQSFTVYMYSEKPLKGDREEQIAKVALCHLIVRRPNFEVSTKRLLHQQVKTSG